MEYSINNSITLVPSDDADEERVMHLKSDNGEIMTDGKSDKFIEEIFQ